MASIESQSDLDAFRQALEEQDERLLAFLMENDRARADLIEKVRGEAPDLLAQPAQIPERPVLPPASVPARPVGWVQPSNRQLSPEMAAALGFLAVLLVGGAALMLGVYLILSWVSEFPWWQAVLGCIFAAWLIGALDEDEG